MQLVNYYKNIDTSELESNADCYVIGNNIYAYKNNSRTRTEYHILNNKVYKYYTQNYAYNYDISGYTCYTYSDISNIHATDDFVMPFYYTLASAIFLFLVYCAYRLILYPFFGKI